MVFPSTVLSTNALMDGCNHKNDPYAVEYPKMGAALQRSGRNIRELPDQPARDRAHIDKGGGN